ncbi:MAG: DNA translocase FtsK, partial [Chloroflexi bacterium]|nr:DNA translocase FtsK [Chloroflexota bacterium]
MAKRKSGGRGRRPWWLRLLRLVFLSHLRYFLLLVTIVALLYWQWPAISSWISAAAAGIWRLFGWGLLIILTALLTLVIVVGRRKYSSFIHHGNRWLAGISFFLAAWGILAFFNQGGDFGLGIIAKRDFIGVLRLSGLLIIGIVLIAPKASWHLAVSAFSWLGERMKGLFSRLISRQQPIPLPEVRPKSAEPVDPEVEKKPTPPVRSPIAAMQGLKQVAQEVWKKYGESPSAVIVDGWKLPPIDILDKSPEVQFSQADNVQRARLIEEALGSYGVEAKVVQINTGPTVTQFGVEPGWDRKMKEVKERDRDGSIRVKQEEVARTRVKVERITSLANDLALALAASSIRIEAPVPGKSIVGIEVPNTTSTMVSLRGVIETSVFQKVQAKAKLGLALGKGAGGEAVAADLAKMPHLLIAGATGSGKTVCLNTIVCGLLLHNTPYDVQFVMIDPKRVEL